MVYRLEISRRWQGDGGSDSCEV